ncbi:MAG: heavy-metal-associated domain-containing protein [Lachnospiraceae bacterium]|nr:heavy-metal-associated domain-containing protein [Lachnospiraceae bacterium]
MIKTILKIDGMACGMCESHINDCIRQNFEIRKIKTSHSQGFSQVISENPLNGQKLSDVIAATGYTLVSVDTEPYEKKGLLGRLR